MNTRYCISISVTAKVGADVLRCVCVIKNDIDDVINLLTWPGYNLQTTYKIRTRCCVSGSTIARTLQLCHAWVQFTDLIQYEDYEGSSFVNRGSFQTLLNVHVNCFCSKRFKFIRTFSKDVVGNIKIIISSLNIFTGYI